MLLQTRCGSRDTGSSLLRHEGDYKLRRWGGPISEAFKRPALAVWGNGLWGSVGRAGRSLPLEGLHQLSLFKPYRPRISVMVVTVERDCCHARFELKPKDS